jgi:hypothetical protein
MKKIATITNDIPMICDNNNLSFKIIDTTDFLQDNGTAAATLPTLAVNNSFYNVYINGVLQIGNLSTYTPGGIRVGKLDISVPAGQTISRNTPVVLEIGTFTRSSTTTVTG